MTTHSYRLLALALVGSALAMPHMEGDAAKCPFHGMEPSAAELRRAKTALHTGRVSGSTEQAIADKINAHHTDAGHALKDCEEYTLDELNAKMRQMWCLKNDKLNA